MAFFDDLANFYSAVVRPQPSITGPLAQRHLIGGFPDQDLSPGRRLRVMARLVHASMEGHALTPNITTARISLVLTKPIRYGNLLEALTKSRRLAAWRDAFSQLPISYTKSGETQPLRLEAKPEEYPFFTNPTLHMYLQDLAYAVAWDIHEACFAFDDPDLFYPGIDEGIEPVTDEHVEFVMWGLQRELNRELRGGAMYDGTPPRPAVVLTSLPFRVQRALAERRRWRYLQFGIGREQWEKNEFSLFDVHEDADWTPPWSW